VGFPPDLACPGRPRRGRAARIGAGE